MRWIKKKKKKPVRKVKKLILMNVFKFVSVAPYIKQVRFKDLMAGDLFYMETPDGELDVFSGSKEKVGCFIWLALDYPFADKELLGNHGIKSEPVA